MSDHLWSTISLGYICLVVIKVLVDGMSGYCRFIDDVESGDGVDEGIILMLYPREFVWCNTKIS